MQKQKGADGCEKFWRQNGVCVRERESAETDVIRECVGVQGRRNV